MTATKAPRAELPVRPRDVPNPGKPGYGAWHALDEVHGMIIGYSPGTKAAARRYALKWIAENVR